MKTVGADGKESTTQTTYQLDGKDYPVTGASDYDSLSAKQVNARTAASAVMVATVSFAVGLLNAASISH